MALPVEAACKDFLSTLRGKSPHTITTYQTGVNRLLEFLADQGLAEATTAELPPDVLEAFYLWMVEQYGREKQFTHATYVAGVRGFFRYLDRRGEAPAGTSFERMKDGLREVMAKATYRTPRTDPELPLVVMAVNEAAEGPVPDERERLILLRDRAIINVLYCTGMRREEVARLNREDILDGRARQAIIRGKGDKERVVFFDDTTLGYIRAYLGVRQDAHPPLFVQHGPARGRPKRGRYEYRLSPQSIWKTVKRWVEKAGLEREQVTTHDFRHTKASTLLNRGAQLSEVQDILGHASPETTKKIYAHYEVSHLRQAFDRYSVPAEDLAASVSPARSGRDAPGRTGKSDSNSSRAGQIDRPRKR